MHLNVPRLALNLNLCGTETFEPPHAQRQGLASLAAGMLFPLYALQEVANEALGITSTLARNLVVTRAADLPADL